MNKKVYQLMSVIVAFALTFGSFTSVSAAPQMAATTYYVSTAGNDANTGTSSAPFKTIQKCLNLVQPGGTCQIIGGTYNEALTLKTSGTKSTPITLKCETSLGCTIDSGASRSLVTSGAISYYVVDGLRFISTVVNPESDPISASVSFSYNFWGDGDKFERGNDGFTLRNCYVEGSVYLYGSDNIVENCELNGHGVVPNGLIERSQPSENNIFRNNVIHDYIQRGGWTLQMVHNTLWENNVIYNIGSNSGIDCDGAGSAVYGCNIKGNRFYNIKGAGGMLLENSFDSIIENNVVYSANGGISTINYNMVNADGFHADKDYTGLVTNTIIRNNVLYNLTGAGIDCHAVKGNTALNNTIYNAAGYGAVSMQSYSNIPCPEWTIKNNIVSQSSKTVFYAGNPPITIDNNFYDIFNVNIYNTGNKTFTQWQALSHDVNSKMGNPLFVNAAAGNFHLQPNSPACAGGAFPCSVVAPTVTNTPVAIASATPLATTTIVPSATSLPLSATPTAVSSQELVTPTASSLPASPTPTASSLPASPTPTASFIPASPTPTASSVPASLTAIPVQPSATPTASSVPVLPTSTSVLPSATPIPATPTASAVPVLPTSTSVQSTPIVQQQSQTASEITYDSKLSSFVYSSDWRDVSTSAAYSGSFKKTNEDGSTVRFTFTGQSFSILYTSGPAFGKVNIYIDGRLVKTLDENEKTTGYKKRWNYPSQLTLGKHILELVAVGNEARKSSIDAVAVR